MVRPTTQSTPWTTQGGEKRAAVQAMFAEIAPVYDRLNGLMSLRLHHRWRRAAVRQLNLKPGQTALDVCCGTGDFLTPLRQAVGTQGRVVGIDFCFPMLELAQPKGDANGLSLGDACRLPVQSASVDAVTVGWGIRNVPDIDAAHREIARVLKPGGRFVSIDMALPRSGLLRAVSRFVSGKVLPVLGKLFGNKTAYTYLPESTLRFADREKLAESMRDAGLTDVGFRDFMMGNICMHWGTKR
jgi:demethylmenaquinone methyltransferase/2-methoxy-6-polyprenyl-1,4-benzoquinol methylase